MCNVAKQLLVAYPINGGPVQAIGKVDLHFFGTNYKNNYDFGKTVDVVRDHFHKSSFKADIAQETGWPIDKIVPQVASIDTKLEWCCLDWYNAMKNQPWQEKPCCKLPQFS